MHIYSYIYESSITQMNDITNKHTKRKQQHCTSISRGNNNTNQAISQPADQPATQPASRSINEQESEHTFAGPSAQGVTNPELSVFVRFHSS